MDNNSAALSDTNTQNLKNKKKLLIIEDDFFLADLLSNMAVKFGFETEKAGDGEEALNKIKDIVFDLALVDIMLPKVDGITVIRAIKSDPRSANTKCVVFTNLEDTEAIKDAKAAGAHAYLIKVNYTPIQIIKYLTELT